MAKNESKVIAVCNQKGGTSKTTTTANLGIGLAMNGKRVLLVDADSQSDLSTSLGWPNTDDLDNTLASLMKEAMGDEPLSFGKTILHHSEGVDLIPSNIELSGVEMNLVNAMSREFVLRDVLNGIKSEYDYTIIDCMPSLGMVTINALAAADSVIIPVQAQYLPAKGMTQLIKTINKVKKQINPGLEIEGVLITLADMRTTLARTTAETIRQNYGRYIKVFDTEIPIATKAAEISAAGKSIYAYDKSGKASVAYGELTKEVLSNGERDKAEPCLSR